MMRIAELIDRTKVPISLEGAPLLAFYHLVLRLFASLCRASTVRGPGPVDSDKIGVSCRVQEPTDR
jgi:hypothetical protein